MHEGVLTYNTGVACRCHAMQRGPTICRSADKYLGAAWWWAVQMR
jgi:hypothetical protein